jgi:hypothetical protein
MDPPDLCLDTLICPQYSPCLLFFRPVPKFQDEGSHVCCFTYVSGPSRREADEIDQGCLLGRGQVEFLEQAGDRSSVLDLSQMLELASFFFDLPQIPGRKIPCLLLYLRQWDIEEEADEIDQGCLVKLGRESNNAVRQVRIAGE